MGERYNTKSGQDNVELSSPPGDGSGNPSKKLGNQANGLLLSLRETADRDWVNRFIANPFVEKGGLIHESSMVRAINDAAKRMNETSKVG